MERGDPPMGVAEGVLRPADAFQSFRETATPEPDDPGITRWIGLSMRQADGSLVECRDVVLIEADFGDWVERWVFAIAIPYPLYGDLFPDHVRRYREQFG